MVFTGLVSQLGQAIWDGNELVIEADWSPLNIGDSVAVNGVCLTVTAQEENKVRFFVMEKTRGLTCLKNGVVNLELALKVGDPLGGHRVQGHVELIGQVRAIQERADSSHWLEIAAARLPLAKGSVAVDGVSLTVAEVGQDSFWVSIIPHTWNVTRMHFYQVDELVNLEYEEKAISSIPLEERMMMRAVLEGEKGRRTAAPNPWVGAVLVRGEEVIAVGHHHRAGEPHAEVKALDGVKVEPEDVLYVTLEPCVHHGRTGPCVEYLIQKGIRNVSIGVLDPDLRVQGKGKEMLEAAGVVVVVGVCKKVVEESLKSYLYHRRFNRPYLIASYAQSLDGYLAPIEREAGSPFWLSSASSRNDKDQRLRATSQAIVVGAGTIISDNPHLTVKSNLEHTALIRVVIDPKGVITNPDLNIFNNLAPTIVFTRSSVSYPDHVRTYRSVEPLYILSILGQEGVLQVLLEGGAWTLAHFWSLIDRFEIYLAPYFLGTGVKLPVVRERFKLIDVRAIGSDLVVIYSRALNELDSAISFSSEVGSPNH